MDDESPAKELLAELDLGTEARPPPVPPLGFYAAYERDITQADLAAMSLPRGTSARPLQRIHASHHSLARCLAAGMKMTQAALVTGYSQVRIYGLQADPAFQSLVEDYRSEAKSIFADLAERMNDLSLDAIELLQERLHENPEGFTVPVLLDLVKTFADRTGHGPGQEVHLKVDASFIDRPPRESYEEWQERRAKELAPPPTDELKKLN